MKKKLLYILLYGILVLGSFSGCGKEESVPTGSSTSTVGETISQEAEFDLDIVKSNIYINGEIFELPMRLSELNDKRSYEIAEDALPQEYIDKGYGVIYLKISNEVKLKLRIQNYFNENRKDAVIYSLSIGANDEASKYVVIDGLKCSENSITEVIMKYGNPDYSYKSGKHKVYIYGMTEEEMLTEPYQYLQVVFDENDMVKDISIILSNANERT